MFCPNCGTQNADNATICTKCNFNLKQGAAPKFKGTMLMMNQPAAAPTPPAGPTPAANKPSIKGTMVGMAPSFGGGSPVPPEPAAPPPAPAGPPPAPPSPPPFAAPSAQGSANQFAGTVVAPEGMGPSAFGASPFGPPPGGFGPPGSPPPGGGFGSSPSGGFGPTPGFGNSPSGGFGNPPPGGGPPGGGPPNFGSPGGPPPGGGFGAPGGGPPNFGSPGGPPPGGGFGPPGGGPPNFGPPGGPPPGGGFGPPPPYGGPPGFGGPSDRGMPPAQPGFAPAAAPFGHSPSGGAMVPAGNNALTGPIGTVRNPLTITLISYLPCLIGCAISVWYGLYHCWKADEELNRFLGRSEGGNILWLIFPLLPILELPKKIAEARARAGTPEQGEGNLIAYIFVPQYVFIDDVNKIWFAKGAPRP